MAYFNAIGEGQLSTMVSLRDKLRRGTGRARAAEETAGRIILAFYIAISYNEGKGG